MRRKLEICFFVLIFLFSAIALGVFLYNSINFPDHSYFFTDKNFDPYTNINVFNGFVNLLYVTYLALIFSTLSLSISFFRFLFKGEGVNGYVFCVTAISQVFVMAVYVCMQFAFSGDWGLYAKSPSAFHNFGGNLFVHVLYPLSVFGFFLFEAKGEGLKRVSFKRIFVLILAFLLLYYLTAKIVGETCFSFRWFPYPIFSTDGIWFAVFKNFDSYNVFLAILMIVFSVLFIAFALFIIAYFVVKVYNKNAEPIDAENEKVGV